MTVRQGRNVQIRAYVTQAPWQAKSNVEPVCAARVGCVQLRVARGGFSGGVRYASCCFLSWLAPLLDAPSRGASIVAWSRRRVVVIVVRRHCCILSPPQSLLSSSLCVIHGCWPWISEQGPGLAASQSVARLREGARAARGWRWSRGGRKPLAAQQASDETTRRPRPSAFFAA